MAVSQNGWPVNPPRSKRYLPDSEVFFTVADGIAGDILIAYMTEIDRRVEDLDWRSSRGEYDDWGWADRPIRGSTVTSNHASATAVDGNATRHPLGARGTFSDEQVAEIRRINEEFLGVVRWGGDYSGRADEMHWELNRPPGHPDLAKVHHLIITGQIGRNPAQEEDEDMAGAIGYPMPAASTNDPVKNDYAKTLVEGFGHLEVVPIPPNDGAGAAKDATVWLQFTAGWDDVEILQVGFRGPTWRDHGPFTLEAGETWAVPAPLGARSAEVRYRANLDWSALVEWRVQRDANGKLIPPPA